MLPVLTGITCAQAWFHFQQVWPHSAKARWNFSMCPSLYSLSAAGPHAAPPTPMYKQVNLYKVARQHSDAHTESHTACKNYFLLCLSCMPELALTQSACRTRPIGNCLCPGDLRCTNTVLCGHAVISVHVSFLQDIKGIAIPGIGQVTGHISVRFCWCWRRCSECSYSGLNKCNAGGLDDCAEKMTNRPAQVCLHKSTLPMQGQDCLCLFAFFAFKCLVICRASEAASTKREVTLSGEAGREDWGGGVQKVGL